MLPTDKSLLLKTLDVMIAKHDNCQNALTFKWKVGNYTNESELTLLEQILDRIPKNSKLRIDANGGWTRNQANHWTKKLINEPRLEWLEQPLPANDIEGLEILARKIPVALDESLTYLPSLQKTWTSWQIRHPLLDGDPRMLLKNLNNKQSLISISTAFETGIGYRWIEHLAALQQKSATPTQAGLALGWKPDIPLFSNNPNTVWRAA